MKRVAIAGNPNAGKSSVFNYLTGSSQQVSNYPGVTVDCKEGILRIGDRKIRVVDLPGTYSLTAYSQEELLARNFIIEQDPDLVIDIVDASNLERNLYLAVQLMEMKVPLVIALNMADLAEDRGFSIDSEKLSQLLGVPVIPTVGNRGKGIKELTQVCDDILSGKKSAIPRDISYGHEVQQEIERVTQLIRADQQGREGKYVPSWLAVKLIENDRDVLETVRTDSNLHEEKIEKAAEKARANIEHHFHEDPITIIAERRYGFAAGAVRECMSLRGEARQNMTDKIDVVVCNKALGPVILFAVVGVMFLFVFKLSDEWNWIPFPGGAITPTGLIESLFDFLSDSIGSLEQSVPMLHSLVDDAIIGGVGGVMVFVPLIFFMFLFISVLEDTGYIARVAFLLDRVMRTFGLQGKSILAMIVSGGLGAGGCAVPGILATRTLREEKDRLVTMLVVPFMNCGAKMPVYAMLIAAFFQDNRTQVMLLLWALSWSVALLAALGLRKLLIRGEQTPFVMELPPYHIPTMRGVISHTIERTWMYIRKAGTIILVVNIVLWALMYFPHEPIPKSEMEGLKTERQLAGSIAGRIGRGLEPVTRAAGFDWRTNISLIGGFAAKEVVVGTMGTVYSMSDTLPDEAEALSSRLSSDPHWSPLRAFAMMVFVMLYAPCLPTMAAIRRESGSWKWALFSTAYSTLIAFCLAVVIFQGGGILGF